MKNLWAAIKSIVLLMFIISCIVSIVYMAYILAVIILVFGGAYLFYQYYMRK